MFYSTSTQVQRFCEVDSWTSFFVNVQLQPLAPATLEEVFRDAIENSFRRDYTRFMIEWGVRYDKFTNKPTTWPRLNQNRRLGLVTEVRVEGENKDFDPKAPDRSTEPTAEERKK